MATLVVGGLAACGHGPMGEGPMGGRTGMMGGMYRGGPMSDADRLKMRERMVERATRELALDEAQKGKLVTLFDKMQEQRRVVMGAGKSAGAGQPGKTPRDEFLGLMAGERFDRARAQTLVDEKTTAVRAAGPEMITAMGDFYDSLKPEQQAKVRDFLSSRGRGHGMHRWQRG
jgi:Spy/CpxP family protein refolding chaperone